MIRFHKEGHAYLIFFLILSVVLLGSYYQYKAIALLFLVLLSLFMLVFSIQFFRNPKRPNPDAADHFILCPADGKVVTIEDIEQDKVQISIFMSPLNVHVNRVPINGHVTRSVYCPGKYLVAWHPKSSTENERHEVDILTDTNHVITLKQIAGAVARRIINYTAKGDEVSRGADLGFIKFGSRVDLIIPKSCEILVSKNDHVKGGLQFIAKLPD